MAFMSVNDRLNIMVTVMDQTEKILTVSRPPCNDGSMQPSADTLHEKDAARHNGQIDAALNLANGHSRTAGSDHISMQSLPSLHQLNATSPRTNSPSRQSPTQQCRGSSPHTQQQSQQHVVHVHINPGETFSVRVGDQIQHIQGPATVKMVSNNGPPLPMPMQVPPGHMVQQIVDENGILTHVILSPQHVGVAPPMSGGSSSTPQPIYGPYHPQFASYSPNQPQYQAPHHQAHSSSTIHMHPVPHAHMHSSTHSHCSNSSHQHAHPQAGRVIHADERTLKQKDRLRKKLRYSQQPCSHTPHSPRRSRSSKVNGDPHRQECNSSPSSEGHEMEEDQKLICEILSKMNPPKVSEVEARSALIQLVPPDSQKEECSIDTSKFKYELSLSDKGKEGRYKVVYTGDAMEITLQDLKPATEYCLKVSAVLDDLKGRQTDLVSFKTRSCEPDPPQAPKLSGRTKTSLQLKWSNVSDNGSKILHYSLECDMGQSEFVEVYKGQQRQFKLTKLSASTGYNVRLVAVNALGRSAYSEVVCYATSGSAPSQPDPPMLSERFVKAMTISWIKRPNDDEFTLQMEDEATGHGFLTVYNGPELSYKIKNLRRNTKYKFRLSASNEEGSSKWSDNVCHLTLPDRPGKPNKPVLKGKVHSHSFRVTWDAPKDNGGADVTNYLLEMDAGSGYELVCEGTSHEFTFDQALPGCMYRIRVASAGAGGQSDWSDCLVVTTQAVPPAQCQPPRLHGKPKATTLHLRWNYPDYDGGSPVSGFEALMTLPNNTARKVYSGPDLDCAVISLQPGRPYLFQCRAINRIGIGPWSDPLEVVSGPGVPDPPRTPLLHFRSPHNAVVSWEEPVNNGATIVEYRLEWQQTPDGEFTQLYVGSAVCFEVKNLHPATVYSFHVQATNSAGTGPFSPVAGGMSPASSPGIIVSLRASATAKSLHLVWKEPNNHGSEILSYIIDIGEKQPITVGNVLEHEIDNLLPETVYRIRIQAVNEIGVGPYSQSVKVVTKSLPPSPPHLECVASGPNSLKVKWGEGKNLELVQYVLEMLRENGSFYRVYHGPSHIHKVNKLSEATDYVFRIYASNEAGDGPYSEVYKYRTTKAPPPAVKSPKINAVSMDSVSVGWLACKPMGRDKIVYQLQIQNVSSSDSEYTQIYQGSETSYTNQHLSPNHEYQVRVCAVRQSADGDLIGAFSPGVCFTTTSLNPDPQQVPFSCTSQLAEPRQWTEKQWAMLFMIIFAVFAIFATFLAQQIVTLYSRQ